MKKLIFIRNFIEFQPAAVVHYAGNGSATFNRNHKVNEELSFDRGNIQMSPVQMVPAADVIKKIEEADERKNVHPDEREENENYANEEPDKDEKDYKEGRQRV
ncbi:hypothetical protein WR25_25350 [Diploscapter pachys]|uniref:Uncharacterized protein n=1 Tax=Diploscapter pachys TaxID=2018661 RepID=A0A2A2JRH5_9BILA|nr:hypothetical protein WR25_25350 [Diploscapter pachys]